MNKIYKVVWNNTLQCYTVVSELAKSHTKNNASKVVKATVLSSLLAVASSTYAAQGGVSVNNTTINIDSEAIYNNTGIGVYNQGTLNFGDNLKLSSDTEPTSGILVNNQSTLNVKGNLSGTNTYLSTENSKVNVNKDLKLDGKTETIFGSFNGSDIKVDGNASVSDLVRFTADRDATIEIGKDLNLNSTLSDASNSLRESVGIYNNSHMTVGGDVNVLGDSLIKSDGDASIEIGGDLNVKVDSHRNEIVGIYNNGSIKVNGNLTADRDNEYVETSDINLGTNAKLDVTGNAEFKGNTHLAIWDNSKASIGGNLKMSGVTNDGSIVYNNVNGNSSLNVAGNVNLSGTNNIHAFDNSELNFEKDLNIESTEVRDIFCVSEGAVGNIKGDMHVTGTTEDGHQNYYDMRNSGTLNVAGNVSFEGTNNLHVFDKSELNVGKNATFNEGEFSVTENSKAKIDGDLTLNHVADTNIWNKASEGSSITVGGNLSLSGLYKEGTGDFTTSAGADEYHRNRFFASGEGSSINVKENTTVENNAELFAETYSNPIDSPDHEKYIDKTTFKDLGRALFEGDVNLSLNGKLGAYNAGEVTVEGNVNAESGGCIQAWDSDSALTIKGDTKISGTNSRIAAGRTGSIKIMGNTDVLNGEISIENKASLSIDGNTSVVGAGTLFVGNNSTATFGGDLTINESKFNVKDNSTATIDGNLILNNVEDTNVWNKVVDNSSMIVNGDLNMKGHYREGYYTEETDQEFFRNDFFVSGQDDSGEVVGKGGYLNIKGNVKLTDNSHFFTESYSNTMDQSNPNHNKYFPKDSFEKLTTSLIEGNITLDRNSRLGSYNAGESTVNGNVTATNGASVEAWNSDALLTIKGDVSIADTNGEIGVGRTADIDIGGNLSLKNDAKAYVGEDSTLSVAKKFLVDNATLEIHGGQLLLSGEDSVLDLTNNGVLKTDEAGSIKLSKGASVESLKETLLSDDTKTTAAGVAEKTFEADALSKVHLTNLGEVSLDEAERLHGVLFNSETGILDLKINLDTDENGNASFTDAVKVAGTTAAQDKTIADVDTSDKKLSDLTSSDLSWGSASLKDGQTDLDLGSGNLVLNNPEANNGSFVSTADGTTGNITMDKDANLALNGNGSIGNVNTTENATGDILIGNDKSGSVTANNLGSEDKAFSSVSVGAGSSVTVKNILNAAKVALEKKAEVIASVINSPELKAIGDDIKIKAEKSVLGGLLSGNNSTLESKTLELADNFNVLGGAKVKAKNLSLKGKMLFADPDWNSNASVVVANNLSGDNGNVLDGALVAGQNSLVAVSDTLDENSAAVLAKSTLSENGTTALGYVGKDITVAANGSITIDGSLTSAPATVEDNTVTVANKSALVLANNSKVSFESADGKVTNNGTIVVSSDTLANNSKITAFSGENVTVEGNGSFDVSSALFSANSNGDGTLTVNYDENKANRALYGTEANVAQSIKQAVVSGVAVNKGTILGDLVNAGNSANTKDTLSQLTRLGTLAGSVANAKLATDTTANAIDSRLGSSGVKTNTQATAQSNKLTVWVQPVFSRQSSSSLDAGNTEYGIKTNLHGGVAGLDVTLSDNFVQGAAITVGSGNSSSKNIKSVSGDFDYYGFNLYGAYVNDALKLSYDLGYTKVSNDATAYNSLGKFTSDIDTKVFTLGIKGAYTFNTSVMDITPHLGVRYAKYDSDDYTATSGLYSVNNEGASSSLVSLPVGVSFSKDISLSSWTVVPTVNLEVIPVTGDKDVDTKSAFDGVVTSVNTKLHDGINYSTFVGLDALYGENFSMGINYNYTGSKNVDDHSVNATLRYTF